MRSCKSQPIRLSISWDKTKGTLPKTNRRNLHRRMAPAKRSMGFATSSSGSFLSPWVLLETGSFFLWQPSHTKHKAKFTTARTQHTKTCICGTNKLNYPFCEICATYQPLRYLQGVGVSLNNWEGEPNHSSVPPAVDGPNTEPSGMDETPQPLLTTNQLGQNLSQNFLSLRIFSMDRLKKGVPESFPFKPALCQLPSNSFSWRVGGGLGVASRCTRTKGSLKNGYPQNGYPAPIGVLFGKRDGFPW